MPLNNLNRFLWVGSPPRWGRVKPYFVDMYRACRKDGRSVLYSTRAALRLAWLPLAPWPVTVLGRLTLYGWGWDLRAFGTNLVWAPREAGLYISPDGTPTRATRWIWRSSRWIQ